MARRGGVCSAAFCYSDSGIDYLQSRLRQLRVLLARGRFREALGRAQQAFASEHSPLSRRRLFAQLSEDQPLTLVIDGSHGGGARIATQRAIERLQAEGQSVLHVTSGVVSRRLQWRYLSPMGLLITGSTRDWLDLRSIRVASLHVHTLVGFAAPELLSGWLKGLQARGVSSVFYWHDHYFCCPSNHLLNAHGDWCELPEPAICATCLPNNQHCRSSQLRQVAIGDWRKLWAPLLEGASQVVVFSASSAELVRQTFSGLGEHRIAIRPHDMSYFITSPTAIGAGDRRLHVGVIGHISYHKGARVVAELTAAMKQAGAGERITVFGALDAQVSPDLIAQTGPYKHSALPMRVAESGVNVLLIPSIWPETFSYTTHEALLLGLPVVGFAIGAQGAVLAAAEGGRCVSVGLSGDQLLAELRLAAEGVERPELAHE